MLVYLLTNEVNGKYYVGKTSKSSLKKYLQNVISMANKGRNNRPLLHRAIRKYGSKAFIIEALVECETNERASNFERLWIIALDSRNHSIGYNLSEGGEGSPGCKFSEEAKARLSAQRKGQKAWNKGVPHTKKARRKMSVAQQGEKNGFFATFLRVSSECVFPGSNRQRIWDETARKRLGAAVKVGKAIKAVEGERARRRWLANQ